MSDPEDSAERFSNSGSRSRPTFIRELFRFLGENKKWWLLPIIIVFVLFGLLVAFGGSAAPFIYTLF